MKEPKNSLIQFHKERQRMKGVNKHKLLFVFSKKKAFKRKKTNLKSL